MPSSSPSSRQQSLHARVDRERILRFMQESQSDAEALMRLVADRLHVDHGPILETIDAATADAERCTLAARQDADNDSDSNTRGPQTFLRNEPGDQSIPTSFPLEEPQDESTMHGAKASLSSRTPRASTSAAPHADFRDRSICTESGAETESPRVTSRSGKASPASSFSSSSSPSSRRSRDHKSNLNNDDQTDLEANSCADDAGHHRHDEQDLDEEDSKDEMNDFVASSVQSQQETPKRHRRNYSHESCESEANSDDESVSSSVSSSSVSSLASEESKSVSPRSSVQDPARPTPPTTFRHRTKGWPLELRFSPETLSHSIFEQHTSLRVFCCTWNLMGNSVGDEEPLRTLIPRDHFDVYAIGTQECERTIAKSAVITRKKGWEQTLARFLGEGYAMLRSHTLQATHLIVFVRKELLPVLSNVGSAAVATGYKDTFGNKGGVGVSFNLGRTSFLFIASHFEAHQNRVKQRNDHFHRIDGLLALPPGVRLKPLLQRTSSPTRGKKKPNRAHQGKATGSVDDSIRDRASFDSSSRKARVTGCIEKDDGNDDDDDDAFHNGDGNDNDDDDDDDDFPTGMDKAKLRVDEDVGPSGYDFNPESDPRGRATARFDRVFWFGDFNYRIDASREKVEGLLSSDSRLAHGSLLANDQLKKEMAAGRVFRNFVEGPVNFKPTYKFDKDSDVYDTSKKQRVPAWTDRILHKSTRPHTIEILHYASEPSIRMSDHRPVAAMYSVAVDGIDDPTLIGVESHEVGKAESQVCLIS